MKTIPIKKRHTPVSVAKGLYQRATKYRFLFEELVKRDFKKKYKRTALGMLWSLCNPLLTLLVMSMVFSHIFGRTVPHYTIYLFSGNLLYSYFREATTVGMNAFTNNASIFSKVKVPKYLFVLSANISSLINFLLTLVVYFIFVIADGVPVTSIFPFLLFPILCMVVFNTGMAFT